MAGRSLQEFVEEASGGARLRVEHDFGDGFVRLRTSEAERRQAEQDIRCSENIVLELLRNARDAHATTIFLAMSREGDKRFLTCIDDGDGIPESMHEHVFEPRVTSKLDTSRKDAWGLHGRGMALYSIAHNAEVARVAASDVGLGCSVHVETLISKLPEKADQSSFPRFEMSDSGQVNVRGPRNILRTACEFAIDARSSCEVFVGSPAEMAATMYSFGSARLSAVERAFCKDVRALPLVKRLAASADPEEFATLAEELGLPLSERTARRVLDYQVEEQRSLLDLVTIEGPDAGQQVGSGAKKSAVPRKRLKLQRDERELVSYSVQGAFREIARRYYLEEDVEPHVRITAAGLCVTVPIVPKEQV